MQIRARKYKQQILMAVLLVKKQNLWKNLWNSRVLRLVWNSDSDGVYYVKASGALTECGTEQSENAVTDSYSLFRELSTLDAVQNVAEARSLLASIFLRSVFVALSWQFLQLRAQIVEPIAFKVLHRTEPQVK